MKCAICNGEIEVVGTWTEGHNAEPVVENGRCCGNCNDTEVIPARLRSMVESLAKKKGMLMAVGKPFDQRLAKESAYANFNDEQRALMLPSPRWLK